MLEIIFGLMFGVMVGIIGAQMVQSITIGTTMEQSNPVPLWNMIQPTITAEASATITGVGWFIFIGLLFLMVVIIGAVFLIGLFLPAREFILRSLMLFSIFFFLVFLLIFWVALLLIGSPFWGLAVLLGI